MRLHVGIYVKPRDVNCIYSWLNAILHKSRKREGKVKEISKFHESSAFCQEIVVFKN